MIVRYYMRLSQAADKEIYRIECESDDGKTLMIAGHPMRKTEDWFATGQAALDAYAAMISTIRKEHDDEAKKIVAMQKNYDELDASFVYAADDVPVGSADTKK